MASETLPYAGVRASQRRLVPGACVAGLVTGLLGGAAWAVRWLTSDPSAYRFSPQSDIAAFADCLVFLVWAGAMLAVYVWVKEPAERRDGR